MKTNLLNNVKNSKVMETKEFYIKQNKENINLVNNLEKTIEQLKLHKMVLHAKTGLVIYFGDENLSAKYVFINGTKHLIVPIDKNDITFAIVNATYIVPISKISKEEMTPIRFENGIDIPYISLFTIGNNIEYNNIENHKTMINQSIEEIDLDTFNIKQYFGIDESEQISLVI